jgi:hypothetical protein
VQKLVRDAIQARQFYANEISTLLDGSKNFDGYARKRLIPKLRFYAGRLAFLGTKDMLSSVYSALVHRPV